MESLNSTPEFNRALMDHEAFMKKYENQRFYAIYPVTTTLVTMSLFGIFGNCNIIWSTIRKRSLRSRCNIMIAATALADVIHQLSHYIFAYCLFFGTTFIPLNFCFWLQIVPAFWMNFATFIVLIIGVDRLISILFPLSYKRSNHAYYLFIMFMFPCLFALYMCGVAYSGLKLHGNDATFCMISAVFHDSVKDKWVMGTLVTNLAVIITYTVMWIATVLKKGKYDKRILRSLTAIMCLVMFGWFSASTIFAIILYNDLGEEKTIQYMLYAGCACINLSISLNYPVYMYFCKEYRVAFIEQLKILTCRTNKNKVVTFTKESGIDGTGTNQKSASTNNRSSDFNGESQVF